MTTTDHLHSHLNSGQPTSPSAGRRARPNTTVGQLPRVDTDRTDENDAPEAPVVLLVHGQPGSSLIWARAQPLLHNRGLPVLAVDRPGYGDTGEAASNQFDNAAALAKVRHKQVRSPAVIVGHSLGAGIARALAATAPQHVRALGCQRMA